MVSRQLHHESGLDHNSDLEGRFGLYAVLNAVVNVPDIIYAKLDTGKVARERVRASV